MNIFDLINHSDIKGVKDWVESKTTNKNVVLKGETPLAYAICRGKEDIATLFVEKKLYIFDADENGDTPLHDVAMFGYTKITLLLIEKGAKVNAVGKYGYLPMHHAAVYGYFKIVRILIEKGSEINTTDKWCRSPLLQSIRRSNTFEASKMLLDEGAAMFNNIKYLKIAHDNNKTLVKHHLKLQAFILSRAAILSRLVILRFSKTFKLSFKE